MDEMFRFFTVRPPQRIGQTAAGPTVIRAYGSDGSESAFHQELRGYSQSGDLAGVQAAAERFITRNPKFVKTLSPAINELNNFLLERDDRPDPRALKRLTDPLLSGDAFEELAAERSNVQDSILALAARPEGREALAAELLRGLHIFGLLDAVSQERGSLDSDTVHAVLAEGIVVLPADVFSFKVEAAEDVSVVVEEEPSAPDRDDRAQTEKQELHEAINELQTELYARVTAATSPEAEITGREVAMAAEGAQMRFGSPWVLNEEAMADLSSGTRSTLHRIASGQKSLNLPDAITHLEQALGYLEASSSPIARETGAADTILGNGTAVENGSVPRTVEAMQGELTPLHRSFTRVLGVADLLTVRYDLDRYDVGEIANVENVLKGEDLERTNRRLRREEVTREVETEFAEEKEEATETTGRFELETETQTTINQDASAEAGLNVTAQYGPAVTVDASADFATSYSREDAERFASTYAQDVVQRSISRLKERRRTERIEVRLTEFEEIAKHEIDNADGAGHTVGIYQWLNKIYKAQIFNYGKRLLIEFMVPEPAVFYRYAVIERGRTVLATVSEPKPPTTATSAPLSPADLTAANYLTFVRQYNVRDVEAPPPEFQIVSATIDIDSQGTSAQEQRFDSFTTKEVVIPDGYRPLSATGVTSGIGLGYLAIGSRVVFSIVGDGAANATRPFTANLLGTTDEAKLPVATAIFGGGGFIATMEILCRLTPNGLAKWQIDTYEKIISAYLALRDEYRAEVAAVSIREGVPISGRNPIENRAIEKTELKRESISMLTGQSYESFGAVNSRPPLGFPEIDFARAQAEGQFVEFLEQAFEWPQMTYVFYPYFWSKKSQWPQTSQLDDVDAFFAAFLKAGYARVVVPVRPGFEQAIMYYIATGQIWNGGQAPQVHDPTYVSIVDELREQGTPSDGTPVGEEWEIEVPTPFVLVRQEPTLPSG